MIDTNGGENSESTKVENVTEWNNVQHLQLDDTHLNSGPANSAATQLLVETRRPRIDSLIRSMISENTNTPRRNLSKFLLTKIQLSNQTPRVTVNPNPIRVSPVAHRFLFPFYSPIIWPGISISGAKQYRGHDVAFEQ